MIAPELVAARRAVAGIVEEYRVVVRERPELTRWEAFAVAKQRRARDIIAANVAVDLAEADRRYRGVIRPKRAEDYHWRSEAASAPACAGGASTARRKAL